MSDEQKNDFWSSSSNDDFWNKPVGDDWLKRDEPKPETNEPSWNENPYYQSHVLEDEVKGSVFHEENTDSTYWGEAGRTEEGRKVHIHTIICLVSIVIMVFVVLAIAAATALTKNAQKKEACVVSYKEENLTSPIFDYYDNNTVTLENNCYTIVNHDIYAGFPEDFSLIAIRVDVESSAYVQNAYAMKNCYIGYEENETVEYKQSLGRDVYYPYVAGYGFDSSSFLSDYGCGNGADITGYFFFLIPADVQEITLYMEKYDLQHDTIDKIETVMSWNMGVLPYDEEIPGRLAKEGGYHYE